MRKNKLYAIGLGLVLGLASPCIPSFAETEAQLPELEAPSETEASAETQAPSETEAPSESELPAETEAPPATDAQKESETLSAPQTEGPGQVMSETEGGTISHTGEVPKDYSQIGPGMEMPSGGSSSQSSIQEFTSMTVENPVVQVAEKYSYEQMEADIQDLQKRYGTAHMQVTVIGTSADGRKIYDILVGNPNAGKHILIQGAIHAREYANPLLMMKQIEDILAFYDTGSYHGRAISDLLNQVAIHFVPMANPDGVALSQFGLDALHSQQLKQTVQTAYTSDLAAGRTTQEFSRYLERWKSNARGVDLNHNFDALWTNTSSNWMLPSFSGYKGLTPISEPESQALVNLMNSNYPWAAVLNYHSMGKVIYWDIEGNKEKEKSQQLAQLMSAATGGYQMLYSGGGGGFKDWVQLKENPVPSITVETGKMDCPMPVSEFESIWVENRTGWAVTAEFVLSY